MGGIHSCPAHNVADPKGKRDHRYIVDLPAYAATTQMSVPWHAKARLRNISLGGLLLELPSNPPFDSGELLRISWHDVVVTGEVRHVISRPGFVGMGVRIREVVTGSVLACAEVASDINAASSLSERLSCSTWDLEQIERGKVVHNALQRAVNVILEFVPAGPEQTAAIRKIVEAAMECSAAIQSGGAPETEG